MEKYKNLACILKNNVVNGDMCLREKCPSKEIFSGPYLGTFHAVLLLIAEPQAIWKETLSQF